MRTDLAVLLAIVGLAVLSVPVYALGPARRAHDPLDMADRGSFVMGGFVRRWFYWLLGPIERTALALRMGPLFFNLLGVAFGVVAAACFGTGRTGLGGWSVLLGGAADVLDGRIARALGIAGRRGAFLDSTLDRFAEFAAFVGLALMFRSSGPALILVVTALGGSLLVSYARARGESVGVVCKLGVMQRAERLLLLGFGAILDPAVSSAAGRGPGALLVPALGLMAIGTVGTAIFRTVWIARRIS